MFSYYKSSLPLMLEINRLIDEKEVDKILKKMVTWNQDQWGYLTPKHDQKETLKIFSEMKEKFYITKFKQEIIGMFAISSQKSVDEKSIFNKLWYFYIDGGYRGLGVGSQMIKKAKEISKQQGAGMLILNTINPHLNKFYEKQGAIVVCDNFYLDNPTTLLKFNL